MGNFIEYTGWLIALLSLVVNIIQVFKNNQLKKEIKLNQRQDGHQNQQVGNNSTANQQSHSGNGDNINVGGNFTK